MRFALLAAASSALLLSAASSPSSRPIELQRIESTPDQDPNEFNQRFLQRGEPVVVTGGCSGERNEWRETAARWGSWNALKNDLGDLQVRFGQGPYPNKSIVLGEFIDLVEQRRATGCSFAALGKETEVVFQYGNLPPRWTLQQTCKPDDGNVPIMSFSLPLHDDQAAVCRILKRFVIPTFLKGHVYVLHGGLLVGDSGDSIGYHRHSDAINALLVGKKQWSVRNATHHFVGIQYSGDIVFIPGQMDHAVVNLEPSIALQLQFDAMHWDNPSLGAMLEHMVTD